MTSPFPRFAEKLQGQMIRCVEKRAISLIIPTPCRQARHNDYQPPGEAVAIRSKLKLRQARRLRSLYQLREKYGNSPPEPIDQQMQVAAKGYDGRFTEWALKWPEIPYITVQRSQSTELYDLVQLVGYDANTAVSFEIAKRKEAGKFAEKLDVREAYCHNKIQQVKGPPFPPVRQLTKWENLNVTPLRIKAKGELRYRAQNIEDLSPSRSIYVNGKVCKLLSVNRDIICIERNHEIGDQEPNRVQQRHELCDDKDLHRALTRYWTQFWNRDDTEDTHAWGVTA